MERTKGTVRGATRLEPRVLIIDDTELIWAIPRTPTRCNELSIFRPQHHCLKAQNVLRADAKQSSYCCIVYATHLPFFGFYSCIVSGFTNPSQLRELVRACSYGVVHSRRLLLNKLKHNTD